MRGPDDRQDALFSVVSLESRVRPDHPLRATRKPADEILKEMSP